MSILYYGNRNPIEIRRKILNHIESINEETNLFLFAYIVGPKYKQEINIYDSSIEGGKQTYQQIEDKILSINIFQYSLVLVEWLKNKSSAKNQSKIYYLIPVNNNNNNKLYVDSKAEKCVLIQPRKPQVVDVNKLNNQLQNMSEIKWSELKEDVTKTFEFCSNFLSKEFFYFEKFAKISTSTIFMHNIISENETHPSTVESIERGGGGGGGEEEPKQPPLSVSKSNVFSIEHIIKHFNKEYKKMLSVLIGHKEGSSITKNSNLNLLSLRELNRSLENFYHEEFFCGKAQNKEKFLKLLVCHMGKKFFKEENPCFSLTENATRFIFYNALSYIRKHLKLNCCKLCNTLEEPMVDDFVIQASNSLQLPMEEKKIIIPKNIVNDINNSRLKPKTLEAINKASEFLEKIEIIDTKNVLFTLVMILK